MREARCSSGIALFSAMVALTLGCGGSVPSTGARGAAAGEAGADPGQSSAWTTTRAAQSAASDDRFFRRGSAQTGGQPASLRWVEGSGEGVTLEASVSDVALGSEGTHGRAFTTLAVGGAGTTAELGRPRLPALRRLVELPAGAEVEVAVEALEVRRSSLASLDLAAPVFPVQQPVEKLPGAAATKPFVQDPGTYGSDELYPAGSVALEGPLVIRGRALWLVTFFPARYRPASGEVEVLSRARIHLDVRRSSRTLATPATVWDDSPSFERWLRANVANPPRSLRDGQGVSRRFAEGILFIVGEAYAANPLLAQYVAARRAEGHRVDVAAISEIGTAAADVRRYVQSQYRSWRAPALRYVVLVGDVSDVPTYKGRGGGKSQATDLYYASVDPEDYEGDLLAPDLVVSRISVNDAVELETYLARAQRYLRADFGPDSKAWMKKISFLASCDQSSVTEGTHDSVVETYTARALFTGTYPATPQPGGDKLYCRKGLTKTAITQALGDGRSIINFSGHGSTDAWADPEYGQSDLARVLPAGAIPFVVSNACITGSFDDSSDCWGEMWLAHPRGAILFWGSSNNSYWDEDDILERRLWDGVFAGNLTRLGDAIEYAKTKTLEHYGVNDTMAYYYEMYNLLGDATIDLFTDVDFEMGAQYPAALPVGADTIDVTVASATGPVAGALVAVRGQGVQQVGYTDAAGSLALRLTPPPAQPDKLEVVVSAHNGKRHEGQLEVIPATGAYLAYRSHRLTSDGTTAATPNPGRRLAIPVELKNNGLSPATGISARLLSSSADVAIVQGQATFEDVAAGGTGTSVDHFVVEISASAADRAVLPFQVQWSVAGGASGATSFVVVVERPHLVYVSHEVDDEAGACDADDIPDVGESSRFAVTVRNAGSGRATSAQFALTCPGCSVAVSTAALPSLGSGESWTATVDVLVPPVLACPTPELGFEVTVSAAELPVPERFAFVQRANGDLQRFVFEDDAETTGQPSGWTHSAAAGQDDWAVVATDAHSPGHSWFASAPGAASDKALVTPPVPLGARSSLRFFHRFALEARFDGAVVELSTDGGKSFVDLGPFITSNGYQEALRGDAAVGLGGRRAWTGESGGWKAVEVDLSSFAASDALIRFRVATDASVGGKGWWIDDVRVEAETLVCQRQSCVEATSSR